MASVRLGISAHASPAAPADREIPGVRSDGEFGMLVAVLAFGLLAQGAFYPAQSAILAAGFAWVAARAGAYRSASDRPAVRAGLVLALALAVSAAANGFPPQAIRPALTLAVALGALGAVRALAARHGSEAVVTSIAVAGAAVAAVGLAGVVFHVFPLAAHEGGVWRAASTLTYTNAAAALLAMSLPAAALLLHRRPGRPARLCAAAILAGLLATLSRGGLLAAGVALAAIAVLGAREILRPLVRPALAALVCLAGLIPSIVNDGARPLVGIAALVAGAVVAGVSVGALTERRIAVAAAALAGLVVVAAPAVALWSDAGRILVSRAGPGSAVRALYWRASVDAIERPLVGVGPGTFVAVGHEGEDRSIEFAHNEPLQAFVETGAVGLCALAFAFATFVQWARRCRPRGTQARVWVAAVAACAAFVVQSVVDFVWHVPALVAVAFVWLAVATIPESSIEGRNK